jgi:hypothetical protein
VVTESEPEVERAADVVERHGPVDIDEKHAQWSGAGQISHPETLRASGAGGLQQSAPASHQSGYPGSMQRSEDFLKHENEPGLFGQQNLNDDMPMGTTYQEPENQVGESLQGSSLEGSAALSPSTQSASGSLQGSEQRDTSAAAATIPPTDEPYTIRRREAPRGAMRIVSHAEDAIRSGWDRIRGETGSDDYYRKHWTSNYASSGASYDDYLPAYRYGSEMRDSDKYRGRDWSVVESELRSDWEARYGSGAASTWEKFKAAIRHGWDRMTGDTGDAYYRSDWNSKYATSGSSYDDYEPAYRYGTEMRDSDKYRGRDWSTAESDLRSDWDTRYGGTAESTWERFKAAVRHGWDRMTGGADADADYRNHWSTNYASTGSSYEDYLPAYRYGAEMRRSDKYRGRSWAEVENDLRRDWDGRYGSGSASTWERFKAAVRHGWERMTS